MLNNIPPVTEDIYQTAFEESAVLAALYTGPDIRIRIVNKPMLDAWGKDDSVIGKTVREANPEWKGQPFFGYFESVYRTGIEYTAFEEKADLPVGGRLETRYFNFSYKPLKNAGGAVWGILHTAVDVTEQVLAKKTRKGAEDMFHLAVQSAELGTWFVDGDSRELQASARTRELFGYYPDEKMSFEAAIAQISELHRDSVLAAIDAAITRGERYDIEYPVTGFHGGKTKWLRVTGRLYKFPGSDQGYLAGTVLDITDRKNVEIRKDEFISVASHELKTPLTSLNAGFQLLDRHLRKEVDLPEKTLHIYKSISVNLRKINVLVEDLLNVTRIQNGQLKLNRSWFNVSQLIDDCCEYVRAQAKHELFVTGDREVKVCADQQKIEQVLVNLVNNAVKYAPESPISFHIESLPQQVKIAVRDCGPGIEPASAAQIFDRFYQADNNGVQVSGLRLGLYISSEIIKQHDGEIGVQSTFGQGSTFWFTLPLETQKRPD
jgi:PAS domain S-box-containing protein